MKKYIGLLAILLLAISCENMFDYSPYETKVSSDHKDLHIDNLNSIEKHDKASKEFSFAIISDSHYQYKYLGDAISNINKRDDIDFVIHAGDIADHGFLKEFEMFANTMNGLSKPYFTVIGNHDYRSNGENIYDDMFGQRNYSFVYRNCKFVFFDDVFWEANETPDLDWLEEELKDHQQYQHVFVTAHIPPKTAQFTGEYSARYGKLMSQNNVSLSIHGHNHIFQHSKRMNDDTDYLLVPATYKGGFGVVTVKEDIEVEHIKF